MHKWGHSLQSSIHEILCFHTAFKIYILGRYVTSDHCKQYSKAWQCMRSAGGQTPLYDVT